MPSIVRILNLGRQHYRDALAIQEKCRRHVIEAVQSFAPHVSPMGFAGYLILVEHYPVYTIGLRQTGWLPTDEDRLRRLGADFCRTNRGGLVTFHGPGQLVAYPVVYLKVYNKGLRWYVCQLEKTMVEAARCLGVQASTTDQTGVWVEGRKLGSIGVHASQFVTMHGMALNCNIDLSWFEHITPCGIDGMEMTSLSKELGCNISILDVAEAFKSAFATRFQCSLMLANTSDLPDMKT